jgi:hypothetical protein
MSEDSIVTFLHFEMAGVQNVHSANENLMRNDNSTNSS